MSKLKQEYDEITEQRNKIIEEIKQLEEIETVKRHSELQRQNEDLYNKQLSLYEAIKQEEYASCNHILVYSKIDSDRYEGRTYKSCGCIKCGLDNSVLNDDVKYLPLGRKIMYAYLSKPVYLNGTQTEIACDLDLAQAIYSKIKQTHPNIDDATAIYYFGAALHDIRMIKVNDDRKVDRAKRLSLAPNFKRWNSYDVHND